MWRKSLDEAGKISLHNIRDSLRMLEADVRFNDALRTALNNIAITDGQHRLLASCATPSLKAHIQDDRLFRSELVHAFFDASRKAESYFVLCEDLRQDMQCLNEDRQDKFATVDARAPQKAAEWIAALKTNLHNYSLMLSPPDGAEAGLKSKFQQCVRVRDILKGTLAVRDRIIPQIATFAAAGYGLAPHDIISRADTVMQDWQNGIRQAAGWDFLYPIRTQDWRDAALN